MKKPLSKLIIILLFISFVNGCALHKTHPKAREKYVINHPELSEGLKQLIKEGKIENGMTEKDVIASWGKPNSKKKSVGSWGVREQWVYKYYYYPEIWESVVETYYLYFENGILKRIEKNENGSRDELSAIGGSASG